MKTEDVVLAAFGQLNRNQHLQIITKILSRKKNIVVRKEAFTNSASKHIQRIVANHVLLSKSLQHIEGIRMVKTLGNNNAYVEFEFLNSSSVDDKIYQAVLRGDYEKAMELLDRLLKLIDDLSTERSRHENDEVMSINNIYKHTYGSLGYMYPGVVDLNPDNFIVVKNGELILFDCEWVFDQPIPKDYVKTRLLHTFFARRSESFAYLPSKERSFMVIEESGNSTYIPHELYKRYSKYLNKSSLNKYWSAEDIFQKSVYSQRMDTAKASMRSLVIKKVNEPNKTYPETEESIIAHKQHSIQKLNEDMVQKESYIEGLENHNKELEKRLDKITSSLPYKIYSKAKSAKNRLM